MKNRVALVGLLLFLTACSPSPAIDSLVSNEDLMAEIENAAQSENPNSGMIPLALDLGSLTEKKLISKASASKIRSLTNCKNLSGIEIGFLRGEVTHINISPSNCEYGE
ncbi:MAG: hypothetical protein CML20_12600 [Rheinheimera sp.]|nr:hypothetical protein [Rheinheimera sp.]